MCVYVCVCVFVRSGENRVSPTEHLYQAGKVLIQTQAAKNNTFYFLILVIVQR